MIIVRFTSGLGNQMFQYSLYSYLKELYPSAQVKADVSWFARFSEHQGYELKRIFQREDNPEFSLEEATDLEIIRCSGRIPNRIKGKLGDIWQFLLRIPHRFLKLTMGKKVREGRIEQTGFEDNSEILSQIKAIDPEKDYYITGFFIEEVYYRDRLESLRWALSFDENYGEKNKAYVDMIRETDSVSIHVRRGDYLSAQYSSSFIALPMEYYKEAVRQVRQKMPNAKFFIFSDDKEFINQAFDWIEEKDRVMVEGNIGADSYRDLQLMSMCKSNIIANSTFSVWAGLLNANPGAQIYYPEIYMKEKDSEEKTIPGFIRIKKLIRD